MHQRITSSWFSDEITATAHAFNLADRRHLRSTGAGMRGRNSQRGKKAETRALDQTGVSVGLDDEPAQSQAKPTAKQSGPIIGQRTQRHPRREPAS